ncbi:Similar to hypothetical protein NFIA_093030 [Neosartorya fischeri NRRL 181]; acc. no. XP_001261238 [Pyronema omphalodes CBS 100304]|uniref:Cell wall mannoprotein 1 n=1 Tax=Pyronema omphalodes (strain CBS 100304) TaxID=1076935 RepID=U4L2K6_PYROM|nr:Similar to hypothetical protein NFIA_093030 [Neosartorya fischeri NRRL 181]; acc. no. XP_001261238 [Pyronema omphalodes CBS 100304]
MRFGTLALFGLTAFTSAASIIKRDAATIIADLGTIDKNIDTCNTKIAAFNGGVLEALAVAQAADTIIASTNKATDDTNASAALNDNDSVSVVFTLSALNPKIKSNLDATVAKKTQFKNGGFGSLVLQQLNSLKTASGNLATALGNKVTAGNKQTVANLAAETAANFDKAIAEFS